MWSAAGLTALLASENWAGVATPEAEPATMKEPTVLFVSGTDAVAIACASLVSTSAWLFQLLRPGPLDGAVNVTVTPLTGLPSASRTSACSGLKLQHVLWDCGVVVGTATIVAGGPAAGAAPARDNMPLAAIASMNAKRRACISVPPLLVCVARSAPLRSAVIVERSRRVRGPRRGSRLVAIVLRLRFVPSLVSFPVCEEPAPLLWMLPKRAPSC